MLTFSPGARITMKQIIAAVCAHHEIGQDEILSDSRKRGVAWPRQQAYWLMDRLRPDLSFSRIGASLRRSDHGTVIHGIEQVNERIRDGREDASDLAHIAQRLGLELNPEATRRWRLTEQEMQRRLESGRMREAA